jgi:Flp pilus assembly protein TadD
LRIGRKLLWTGVLCTAVCAAAEFDLIGRLEPNQPAPIHLHGATTPFSAETEAGPNGKFRFRHLAPGSYVLTVSGLQRTVEIGPGLADVKGRVTVTISLRNAGGNAHEGERVSIHELAVPDAARREYQRAEKALGRRDAGQAERHLKRALELAPRFSAAWNELGTIAYQAGRYQDAESDFRTALQCDPGAYAPLVNLGGVLLNLSCWKEALEYNRLAVLRNPSDALANSQLGIACFYAGQIALAERYLRAAKQIDPAHFSHPQLMLAEIHLRRNESAAAADELQDLLTHHPDLPNAAGIRQAIARLREQAH